LSDGNQSYYIIRIKKKRMGYQQFVGKRGDLRNHLKHIIDFLTSSFDYTKFIIVGRSRTGSNYLRSLLNSHRNITTYGEIIQDLEEWDHTGYFHTLKKTWLHQHDPLGLVEKEIFRKYPPRISAVGFKLFYYHARKDPWKPIWSYLQNLKGLRILHVKRTNILRTHLSRKKAELTNRWVNTTGLLEKLIPIELDYRECLNEFIETRRYENEIDTMFHNHSILNVFYKDLSGDYRSVMKKVQDFLGVQYEECFSKTYKQAHHSLSEAISNYWKLKESFIGTEWEEFFED
jgi:LPS sulfotransferase NodH